MIIKYFHFKWIIQLTEQTKLYNFLLLQGSTAKAVLQKYSETQVNKPISFCLFIFYSKTNLITLCLTHITYFWSSFSMKCRDAVLGQASPGVIHGMLKTAWAWLPAYKWARALLLYKWQGSPHSWQIKAATLSQHYSERHEFSRETWHRVLHQHWRKAETHRATVPPHHHCQASPWWNYTHWVCFKWSTKESPATPTHFGKTGCPSCRWWTRARTLTPWWEERAQTALQPFASKRGVTTIPSFYGCWGVHL